MTTKKSKYTEHANRQNQLYVREHQKQIAIKYRTEEYEKEILPFIQASGLPTATFIKQAIKEKIEKMKTK